MDKALRKLVGEFLSVQFARFFFSALAAAAVNFVSRLLLDPFVGYSYAIVLAYIIGTVFAFLCISARCLGRAFVRYGKKLPCLFFVTLAAIAQTLIVSVVLADHLFPAIHWNWHPKEIAHVIGMGVPMFSSFLGTNT